MRKIWDKFVAWLYKVPFDKWLHFIFGVLIAAFFACALGMKACIVPVVFAGFCKEFFDLWTTNKAEWKDMLATLIGGAFVQGFVALGCWWGFFA